MSNTEVHDKESQHRSQRISINTTEEHAEEQKQITKMRRMMQRLDKTLQGQSFDMFDLKEIQDNRELICRNRKFASLLTQLKNYNIKLKQNQEDDVVNYRLYEFCYSTLRICNTKTPVEVEAYLTKFDSWLNHYNKKREFCLHPGKKKKNSKRHEDDLVRQTFKSYLPSQISQYTRKIFMLPKKPEPVKKTEEDSDDDLRYAEGLIDGNQDGQEPNDNCKEKDKGKGKGGNKNLQLPNLKSYRRELMEMRQAKIEKEEAQIHKNLRRHKTRVYTQISNNTYKVHKNRNDTYTKTQGMDPDLQQNQYQTKNNNKLEWHTNKLHKEDKEKENKSSTINILNLNNNMKKSKKNNSNFNNNNSSSSSSHMNLNLNLNKKRSSEKDMYRVIVKSTSVGFFDIKKRRLNIAEGNRHSKASELPRFFETIGFGRQRGISRINEEKNSRQIEDTTSKDNQNKEIDFVIDTARETGEVEGIRDDSRDGENSAQLDGLLGNILGISLMRNPFQIVKGKKQRKKK